METRLQTALVKQLQRQMRNQERRENKTFHTELRKRARQFDVVHDHFHTMETYTKRMFDDYFETIKRAVELNKTRFDLSIAYEIDNLYAFDTNRYHFDVDGFEEEATRMFKSSNDVLFFQSLYSYPSGPRPDSNNDFFYIFIGVSLVLLNCFQNNG
jgi:hypothetical protein